HRIERGEYWRRCRPCLPSRRGRPAHPCLPCRLYRLYLPCRPCHLSRQPSPAVPPAPLVRRHLACRPGRAAPARLSDRDRGCTPPVRSKSPERVLERVSWPPLSTKFLRDRDARPASAGPSPAIAAANVHARSRQRLLRFPGDRQVADIFPP